MEVATKVTVLPTKENRIAYDGYPVEFLPGWIFKGVFA
jgi:hypothetical protein